MKTSTYPYAPIPCRDIPAMLAAAAFNHGVDMMSAVARGKTGAISDGGSFELTLRLEADMRQLERGPLEAVTQ